MLLLTLSALFILYTKNPLHAVLGLILVFINSSLILLSLNADFLALIYLIVYVGAICILFLFVIMLLNLRSAEMANKPIYKNALIPYMICYLGIGITYIIAYLSNPGLNHEENLYNLIHENFESNFIISFIFENITSFILLTILLFLGIVSPIFIAKNKKKK